MSGEVSRREDYISYICQLFSEVYFFTPTFYDFDEYDTNKLVLMADELYHLSLARSMTERQLIEDVEIQIFEWRISQAQSEYGLDDRWDALNAMFLTWNLDIHSPIDRYKMTRKWHLPEDYFESAAMTNMHI